MKNVKNKGFTLIELLAVIVVLAIIALIATPIVINIIGNSKESADDRSAELYLHAVEQAVARKNLSGKFSPTTCEIQSDGNLKCDGDTLLEVQVENTKPTSGTITFERGKISDYTFEINSKEYTNIPKIESTAESCFETKDVEGGVSITKYNCGKDTENEVLDVVIPNTINGKKVVDIGGVAFDFMGLTSVIIPSSVTSISGNAFSFNQLTNVTIPEGVTTIREYAFFGNHELTSVTIPSSVTTIGDYAFSYNQLTSVEIPEGVITIGDYAFNGNKLTSVTIPNSVTAIGAHAFDENQLTSVTIPNSVITIGERAFLNNDLTSVIIPSSVTTIGDYAFSSNKLTSVTIKGKTTTSDFKSFGTNVFGWASGYSNSNISFEP